MTMFVMEGVCGIYNGFTNKCGHVLNGSIIMSLFFKYRERESAFRGLIGKTLRLMKKACTKSYLSF